MLYYLLQNCDYIYDIPTLISKWQRLEMLQKIFWPQFVGLLNHLLPTPKFLRKTGIIGIILRWSE
jgi:hypothetical protein